jgi:alpha-tubulin suppressor-like RCC1 family protein
MDHSKEVFVPTDCTQRQFNVPEGEDFDSEFDVGFFPAKAIPRQAAHKHDSFLLEWADIKVESQHSYPRVSDDYNLVNVDGMGMEDLIHPNDATICHALRKKFRAGHYCVSVGRSSLFFSTLKTRKDGSEVAIMRLCSANANKDDIYKSEMCKTNPSCSSYFLALNVLKALDGEKRSQVVCFNGRQGSGKSEHFNEFLSYIMFDSHNFTQDSALAVEFSTSPFKVFLPKNALGKNVAAMLHLVHAFTEIKSEPSASSSRTMRGCKIYYSMTSAGTKNGVSHVELNAPLLDPMSCKIKHPPAGEAGTLTQHPYHLITMFCCYINEDPNHQSLVMDFKLKDSLVRGNLDKNATRTDMESMAADFARFQSALLAANVSTEQFDQLMTTLAAIINLMSVGVVGNDSAIISGTSKGYIANAEQLLGMPTGSILLLLTKKMDLGATAPEEENEADAKSVEWLFSQMPHRSADSKAILDYFVFELYSRAYTFLGNLIKGKSKPGPSDLFVSLVDCVSYPSSPIKDDAALAPSTTNISTFAHMVPAYAAEKLRAMVVDRVYTNTIEEYRREGVDLDIGEDAIPKGTMETKSYLDFFDIRQQNSVSFAVAEIAFMPRGDDKAVADKIYTTCKSSVLKLAGQRAGDKSFKASAFTLAHSFGTYRYAADNLCSMTRAATLFDPSLPGYAFLEAATVELLVEGAPPKKVAPGGDDAGKKKADNTGPGRLKIAANTNLTKVSLQKYGFLPVAFSKVDAFIETAFGRQKVADSNTTYVMAVTPNRLLGPKSDVAAKWHPQLVSQQTKHLLVAPLAVLGAACFPISRTMLDVYKTLRSVVPFKNEEFPYVKGNSPHMVNSIMVNTIIEFVLGGAILEYNIKQGKDGQRLKMPVMGKNSLFMFKPFATLMDVFVADALSLQNRSATIIQKHGRRIICVRNWQLILKSVYTLQTNYRMSVERRGYIGFLRSCRKIMATLMMLVQTARYRLMKRSINKIKPWFKRKLGRLKYIHLLIQMRTMQALIRGTLQSKRTREVLKKLVAIQDASRSWVGRIRYKRKCSDACTVIQRIYRGWLSREYNNSVVQKLNLSRHYRATNRLAVKLQAVYRGLSVRERARYVNERVSFIQRWLKARKVYVDFLCVKYLVLWLQSQCRKTIAVNRVCGMMNTKLMLEDALAIGSARNKELMYTCHCPQSALRLGSRPHAKGHMVVSSYALAILVENAHIHSAYPNGWMTMLVQHSHRLWNARNLKKSIESVAVGYTHTILLDDTQSLWAVGLGDGGQLGQGDRKSHDKPVLMDRLMGLISEDETMLRSNGAKSNSIGNSVFGAGHQYTVKQICCGRDHTLLLTGSGRVWSWGGNIKGQLGHSMFESSATPRLVGVHHLASTTNSSNPILKSHSKDSKKKANGDSAHNAELSVFSSTKMAESVYVPFKNIKSIACGSYHSCALSDSGILYTWGASWGLGRPTVRSEKPHLGPAVGAPDINPNPVKNSRKEMKKRKEAKKDIAKQRLKKALAANHDCEPASPPFFNGSGVRMPITSMVCGENHVVVKMAATVRNIRTGIELYAWGNNTSGQCGVGDPTKEAPRSRRMSSLFGEASGGVAMGTVHDVIIEPKRVKLPVQMGEFNNGAMSDTKRDLTPPRYGGLGSISESGGGSVGLSPYGRPGEKERAPVLAYSEQDMASAVLSAGARHTLLALKGDVWAWGSNSHGQLGDGTFVDSHVPRRVWRHVTPLGTTAASTNSTTTAAKDPTGRYPGGNGKQFLTVHHANGPEGPKKHRSVTGPYVKTVTAGYTTSFAITYSSRNIIAQAQRVAAQRANDISVVSGDLAGLSAVGAADKDAAPVATSSAACRMFVWGRSPAETAVPLLGNETNNQLGKIPDMAHNPGPMVIGGSQQAPPPPQSPPQMAKFADAFAQGAAHSHHAPPPPPPGIMSADGMPVAPKPALKGRRRASLLELTQPTLEVHPPKAKSPGDGSSDKDKEHEIALLRADGTPKLNLPVEVEGTMRSKADLEAIGMGDEDFDGGSIVDVTDVGVITSSCPALTLLTYECEESPRQRLALGSKAMAGASSSSTYISTSPSKTNWAKALSSSNSQVQPGVSEEKEAVPTYLQSLPGAPPSPSKDRPVVRSRSPGPGDLIEGWQTSPERFGTYNGWLSSSAKDITEFRKAEVQRRSPSPKRRPMPAWHDQDARKAEPMTPISFAADQKAINESMRELAVTTSWVPGVVSLSERMMSLGRNLDGTALNNDDDNSSVTSFASYTTFNSDGTTESRVRRRVKKRLAKEKVMVTANIRSREKKIPGDAMVALFAPFVAQNQVRDNSKKDKKKTKKKKAKQSGRVGFAVEGDSSEESDVSNDDSNVSSEMGDYFDEKPASTRFRFAGESEDLSMLKAGAALEIEVLSSEVVNSQMRGTVEKALGDLPSRRASLKIGQAAAKMKVDVPEDLSERTAKDGTFIGLTTPPSGRGKFVPGKIAFGSEGRSSPSNVDKNRPGSPIRLAVVRDVHNVISDLKQDEMIKAGRKPGAPYGLGNSSPFKKR